MGIISWVLISVVAILLLWVFVRWFWGGVLLRRFKAWRDRMSILYHRRQDVPVTNGEKVVLERGLSSARRRVVLKYEADLRKGRIEEYYDASGSLCVRPTEKMKAYKEMKREKRKRDKIK